MNTVMNSMNVRRDFLTKGEVGIEIEVEGADLPILVRDGPWRCEYDGSLKGRENTEYVLRGAMLKEEADKAVDYLIREMQKANTIIDDSVRAGVHIHLNVQELTIPQLYSLFTLYIAFEPVLLEYCGEGRNGNLFCLPVTQSPIVITRIKNAIQRGNYKDNFQDDDIRYSAMNLSSLHKYGSLEFRALRTPQDLNMVKVWGNILLKLKREAEEYSDPLELIQNISEMEYEAFFEAIMGASSIHFKDVADKHSLLKRGMREAQHIAYATNWKIIK